METANPAAADAAAASRRLLDSLLERFEDQAEERQKTEKLSEINFTLGVCNALFLAWLIGAYPAYFFLAFLVEAPYCFYRRWKANKNLTHLRRPAVVKDADGKEEVVENLRMESKGSKMGIKMHGLHGY